MASGANGTALSPPGLPSGLDEAAMRAAREKQRVALTSVAAAVLLTGMKLTVGLLTGSLGLLAEAAHSGLDLVAALITYLAVRVADRPADAEHLYGHGKVENLAALLETLLLLVTCAWIMHEAISRLFFKFVPVDANVWAFLVVLVSIVVDLSRARALRRVARRYHSQALEADALHFSTDVWSSLVVLLGLTLVALGNVIGQAQSTLVRADAVAALVVALLVVYVSLRLGRRTIDALLDQAPPGMAAAVLQAVHGVADVLECRRLRVRQAGPRMFVDLTIGVRRGHSLERGHAISTEVEERIHALYPQADVVVHVDPVSPTDESVSDRIRAIAAGLGQTVHHVRLGTGEDGRVHVELHVEADEHLDLRAAHQRADDLEAAVAAELPHVTRITTHIEPARDRQQVQQDVTTTSGDLVAQVRAIVLRTPGVLDCHDIEVRRAGSATYLSLHCTFAAGLSIRQVHEISTRLESRLRAEIPGLARVTTHPEPVGDPPDQERDQEKPSHAGERGTTDRPRTGPG
jgi:cation diffusion facilitator family transporter